VVLVKSFHREEKGLKVSVHPSVTGNTFGRLEAIYEEIFIVVMTKLPMQKKKR
jgi:hypothetical protein